MKFQKFPSLTNSYADKFLAKVISELKSIKTQWVVTEKIHGANYSFWFNNEDGFRCAKRTCFLDEESNFFNHKDILANYKELFSDTAKDLYPNKTVALYGEICGGSNLEYARPVQSEVYYFDHTEFLAFNLYVDGELQNYHDMVKFTDKANIPRPPCLGIFDKLEDALAVDFKFDSLVSGKKDNVCEGTVVSTVEPILLSSGERPAFKQKNDAFKEKAGEKKPKKGVSIPADYIKVFGRLTTMITNNRFNNMISKLEKDEVVFKNFNKLLIMFSEDVIEEYERENLTKIPGEVFKGIKRPFFAECAKAVKFGLLEAA